LDSPKAPLFFSFCRRFFLPLPRGSRKSWSFFPPPPFFCGLVPPPDRQDDRRPLPSPQKKWRRKRSISLPEKERDIFESLFSSLWRPSLDPASTPLFPYSEIIDIIKDFLSRYGELPPPFPSLSFIRDLTFRDGLHFSLLSCSPFLR